MSTDDPLTPPQVIPRPPNAQPGGPPPWSNLHEGDRRGLYLARVLSALDRAGHLGEPQSPHDPELAWVSVFESELPSGLGAAAVLVALFEEAGETRVVLTRRSSELRHHRGEVSFPGGRLEEGEDAATASRREACEEVGLAPDAVDVVGSLSPVMTFLSGTHITPVVATLAERPTFVPNPAEVERCFDVALAELADPHVFHEERWSLEGRKVTGASDGYFPVWFFEVAGEMVWGATGRMLYELLSIVLSPAGGTAT